MVLVSWIEDWKQVSMHGVIFTREKSVPTKGTREKFYGTTINIQSVGYHRKFWAPEFQIITFFL